MYRKPTTKKSNILLRAKQISEKIVKNVSAPRPCQDSHIAIPSSQGMATYSRILWNIFFSRFCPSFSSSMVALLNALRSV